MVKINKFFIPYVIMLIFAGFGYSFFVAFFWIVLHETSHIIAARCLGIDNIKMHFIPMGTYIESKMFDETKPKEDIIISFAGPLVNIIMAILLYKVYTVFPSDIVKTSFNTNLVLGVFNLIPAFPLDGARILRAVLSRKIMYKRANKITVNCSLVAGFLLLGYFIFLLSLGKVNLSLGLIAVLIITISYKERERIMYIIMGDIIRKKRRFLKDNYIENKTISVYYKKDLITVLGLVDKNKYNLFTLLDEEMKVIDVVTEYEILEGLKLYGNISIEEFLKIRDER